MWCVSHSVCYFWPNVDALLMTQHHCLQIVCIPFFFLFISFMVLHYLFELSSLSLIRADWSFFRFLELGMFDPWLYDLIFLILEMVNPPLVELINSKNHIYVWSFDLSYVLWGSEKGSLYYPRNFKNNVGGEL